MTELLSTFRNRLSKVFLVKRKPIRVIFPLERVSFNIKAKTEYNGFHYIIKWAHYIS